MRSSVLALVFVSFFPSVIARAQAPAPAAAPSPETLGWVRVPPGSFEMGCVPADERCAVDESPRHRVTISRAFDLMATEVTLGQFGAFMKEVDPQPPWSTSPEHPVVSVVWDEAVEFCRT